MFKIRITSMPDGAAPEWIRKQWVGLELPVDTQAESAGDFIVPADSAIQILKNKDPAAGRYYKEAIPPRPDTLTFGKACCELLG